MPTRANYAYSSRLVDGPEVVTIRPTDAQARTCSAANLCKVFIGIYGYTSANFSLVMTTENGTTVLLPGFPFTAEVAPAGRTRFYSLAATDAVSPVVVTVSPLSGDPDLYIFKTPGNLRNSTAPCAYSNGVGVERVQITQGSSCFCGAPPCTYWIGVFASDGFIAAYTIEGDSRAVEIETLVDGVTVPGASCASMKRRAVARLS